MLNQHNFSSPILLNIECCQILFMGMAVGTWEFEGHKEDCGLAIQLTWSPNTDLRVSTARTVPRSLRYETWNMIRKQHKNHINLPSVVESALSTVDRSAASRGAIEGAKPLPYSSTLKFFLFYREDSISATRYQPVVEQVKMLNLTLHTSRTHLLQRFRLPSLLLLLSEESPSLGKKVNCCFSADENASPSKHPRSKHLLLAGPGQGKCPFHPW